MRLKEGRLLTKGETPLTTGCHWYIVGWLRHSHYPMQLVPNSVHKWPKTAPRGLLHQFVYTLALPHLSTTAQ